MIPAFVAIGVVIAGLAITTTYVVLEVQKRKKNSEDTDFRCPECMAEFKEGEFECPVCGSAVTADAKMCMVCSERFEEEETFECPHCGSPIPPDTIVCQKCNEEFWSPVRPPTIAEVEAISGSEESEESPSEVAPS
jgi:DNA-directed RNA polymerase subunit RPC12/RpoP